MLVGGADDESDFVKDQIKSLDKQFAKQGLFDLNSQQDKSEITPRQPDGRDLYMGKIFDMEKLVAQGEDKYKE